MKHCPKCDTDRPLTDFYIVKGVVYPYCKECKRVQARTTWKKRDPVVIAAVKAAWKERNPEYMRLYSKQRRVKSPEYCKAATRKSYKANKEKRKVGQRAWALKNKHKTQSYWAMRKARKANATPAWADRKFIENMYICSRLCSESTGIPYHVDHIVPLYSRLVCGLHISDNLQVISASENTSKSNHYWPGMPG